MAYIYKIENQINHKIYILGGRIMFADIATIFVNLLVGYSYL